MLCGLAVQGEVKVTVTYQPRAFGTYSSETFTFTTPGACHERELSWPARTHATAAAGLLTSQPLLDVLQAGTRRR